MAKRWSQDEDRAIRRYYSKQPVWWLGWRALLPNRSEKEIEARAKELDIHKDYRAQKPENLARTALKEIASRCGTTLSELLCQMHDNAELAKAGLYDDALELVNLGDALFDGEEVDCSQLYDSAYAVLQHAGYDSHEIVAEYRRIQREDAGLLY